MVVTPGATPALDLPTAAEELAAAAAAPEPPSNPFSEVRDQLVKAVIRLSLDPHDVARARARVAEGAETSPWDQLSLGYPAVGFNLDKVLVEYLTPDALVRAAMSATGEPHLIAALSRTVFPLHCMLLMSLGPAPQLTSSISLKDLAGAGIVRGCCLDVFPNPVSELEIMLSFESTSIHKRLEMAKLLGLDPVCAFLHKKEDHPAWYTMGELDPVALISVPDSEVQKLLGRLAAWPQLVNRVESLREGVYAQC